MKPKQKPTNSATALSLTDLHAACNDYKTLEIHLDAKLFAVSFRRLNAAERVKMEEVSDAIMPNVVRGATPEQDRLNYADPDFIKRKREAQVKARAIAIYWCVPDIQKMKPELREYDAIRDFVQASFPDGVLSELFAAISNSGVTEAEVVNFTSSSGSVPS